MQTNAKSAQIDIRLKQYCNVGVGVNYYHPKRFFAVSYDSRLSGAMASFVNEC